jgi:hypothetical protein
MLAQDRTAVELAPRQVGRLQLLEPRTEAVAVVVEKTSPTLGQGQQAAQALSFSNTPIRSRQHSLLA